METPLLCAYFSFFLSSSPLLIVSVQLGKRKDFVVCVENTLKETQRYVVKVGILMTCKPLCVPALTTVPLNISVAGVLICAIVASALLLNPLIMVL